MSESSAGSTNELVASFSRNCEALYSSEDLYQVGDKTWPPAQIVLT